MVEIAKIRDLTGMIFGRLTVLKENGRTQNGNVLWECQCSCENQTIINVSSDSLVRGNTKSCGCLRKNDLTGKTFGRWKVLYQYGINRYHRTTWVCECQCEKKTIKVLSSRMLTEGQSKSCGCYRNDRNTELNKKYNNYDLSKEYGIGWTTNTNKEFYFDLEDFDLIKNYAWYESDNNYIVSYSNNKYINLHRTVMRVTDDKITIDHIFHNKNDNRKEFLRIATPSQNVANSKLKDKSKVKGVYWNKRCNKWEARIKFNGKVCSKLFNDYDEAVAQRKAWEQEFFGEFAYQEPPPEYIEELEQLKQQAEELELN